MFLDTVSEPCVRVLLEPQSGIAYGMIKGEPETLLSQANLELYSRRLFPCFGHGGVAPVHTRIQEHVDAVRMDENAQHNVVPQQDGIAPDSVVRHDDVAAQDDVPLSHEEQEEQICVICREEFSDDRLQVCLPCTMTHERTFRHCHICRPCLVQMMLTSGTAKCPICRREFNVHQVQLALQYGCLDYPIIPHRSHVRALEGWPEQGMDERGNEWKKQCLTNLSANRRIRNQSEVAAEIVMRENTLIVTPQDYAEKLAAVVDQGQTECVLLDRIYSDHRKHRW